MDFVVAVWPAIIPSHHNVHVLVRIIKFQLMFCIFVVFYFDITHVPTASYVTGRFFCSCLTSFVFPPYRVCLCMFLCLYVHVCMLPHPPCCCGAPEEEGRPRRRRTPRFLLKPWAGCRQATESRRGLQVNETRRESDRDRGGKSIHVLYFSKSTDNCIKTRKKNLV